MRKLVVLTILLTGGWRLNASDTTYRLKVVVSDHSTGHVEAKFTTMPEDLRIVCEGETNNLPFENDYVRIDYDDKHGYTVHGTKLQCKGFVWVK